MTEKDIIDYITKLGFIQTHIIDTNIIKMKFPLCFEKIFNSIKYVICIQDNMLFLYNENSKKRSKPIEKLFYGENKYHEFYEYIKNIFDRSFKIDSL